jgi:hypothetical protein
LDYLRYILYENRRCIGGMGKIKLKEKLVEQDQLSLVGCLPLQVYQIHGGASFD